MTPQQAALIINGLGWFVVTFCGLMLVHEVVAWFRPTRPIELLPHDYPDSGQPTHKLAA